MNAGSEIRKINCGAPVWFPSVYRSLKDRSLLAGRAGATYVWPLNILRTGRNRGRSATLHKVDFCGRFLKMLTTALIGCGPMALYVLKRIVAAGMPLRVRLYDRSDRCGAGMPYSSALNTDEMLSNAFSREIPPVTRPLIDWLRDQDDSRLARWSVSTEETDSREFYPRTLLGAYFEVELDALCALAGARGHEIIVHTPTLNAPGQIEPVED